MDEDLAGARQRGDQGLDGAAMIARRGIDDGVGGAGLGLQQCRVVERSDDRLDAIRRDRGGLGVAANEAANLMARGDQRARHRAADIAICPGEEDLHSVSDQCPDSYKRNQAPEARYQSFPRYGVARMQPERAEIAARGRLEVMVREN